MAWTLSNCLETIPPSKVPPVVTANRLIIMDLRTNPRSDFERGLYGILLIIKRLAATTGVIQSAPVQQSDEALPLPEEVIERIAAGVNFRNNFVEVVAEFFDADLLPCADEDAGCFFAGDPAGLELLQRAVDGLLGRERKLVVGLVGVGVHLVEHHVHRLVGGTNVPQGLFHHLHLFLEIRV